MSFARYVESQEHHGPLTIEIMARWAKQDKWQRGDPRTWARRLMQLPLLASTVDALHHYRNKRDRHVPITPEMPFFVSSQGRGLSLRQVSRVFAALRQELGWVSRGAHEQPRIQDLRHTFAVRRVTLWQAHGVEIDQAMLAALRQQLSMRMRSIAIFLRYRPLPLLYKTLGTCSRHSGIYELSLLIRLPSIDLQSPCGVVSRHRTAVSG